MKEVILVMPKLGIGGIQRALTNLANWFAENNYNVVLISCKKEELFYKIDRRIELVVPDKTHPGNKANILFHYIRIIKYLRNELRNRKCINVISFGDAFNPLVIIASFGLKKKVHISDRTSPDYQFKWYIKLLKFLTYRYSTTFIAQTSLAASYNANKYSRKLRILTIPNPVLINSDPSQTNREKIILYVGRFAWEKNPASVIKSFASIKSKNDWKLIMLGDGPLLNKMILLADELDLGNAIEFKGRVSNVNEFLKRSSIYVLPSLLEGFPNALCEAMAYGNACICSSRIPYAEIGKENDDFVVCDPQDTTQFSNNLEVLMNSEELRRKFSKNAVRITDRLSIEHIGRKFESILI